MGVWIKFFVSWKRDLDNPNYDDDLLAINNDDVDEINGDKDDPCRNDIEEENKDAGIEYNSKNKCKQGAKVTSQRHCDFAIKNHTPNVNDDFELKEL